MTAIKVQQATTDDVRAVNTLGRRLIASAAAILVETIGHEFSSLDADLVFVDICTQNLLQIDPELIADYLHHTVDLRRDQQLGKDVDTDAAHGREMQLLEAAMNAAALRAAPPDGQA